MVEQTTSNDHGTSSPADPKVVQSSNKRRIPQALNPRIKKVSWKLCLGSCEHLLQGNGGKNAVVGPQKMGNIISTRLKNEEWLRAVPECPVYRPTLEEFQDPLGYIEKVQFEAQKWGACVSKERSV